MNTILEYADIFYNKRYIIEKEARINALLGVEQVNYRYNPSPRREHTMEIEADIKE